MSEDKFNLKWNDFESHIGTSFKELRDENDLFDVWLNCEDGEMAAHKLVLSSCSSVLKKLLRRRQTPGGGCGGHNHVVYLRGVSKHNLQHILDFMYHGEVSLAQDQLNSFLAVAEDLQVKGLTQGSKDTNTIAKKPLSRQANVIPGRQTQTKPVSAPTLPVVADDDILDVTPAAMVKQEQELYPAASVQDDQMVGYQDDEYGGYDDGYDNYQDNNETTSDNKVFLEHDQIESYVRDLIGQTENKSYMCGVCQKEGRQKQDIERHIESKHIVTRPFECNICETKHKTKRQMQEHTRSYHKI